MVKILFSLDLILPHDHHVISHLLCLLKLLLFQITMRWVSWER